MIVRPLRVALVALSGLALAACEQTPSGPSSAPLSTGASFDHLGDGSTELAFYSFENVADGAGGAAPFSVASSIVTATPVTQFIGAGVVGLNFGVRDWDDNFIGFSSGIYQNVPPANYNAFQVGLASASPTCAVSLTRVSFELEHNVVNGGQPIAGVVERRSASGVLLGSYPTTIVTGFAVNNPPRPQTVNLTGATLTSETTYFRFRMNQNIAGTSSAYTAGLHLDDLRFEGTQLCPPTVSISAPPAANEGEPVTLAATVSGTGANTTWSLGDGTTGTGALPTTHTYADNGSYQIVVTAQAGSFAPVSATHTIVVANVAPTVSAFPGATILQGETYTASGSFSDPGADTHTATVSYGGAATPLSLAGSSFTLSNVFGTAGAFTVSVVVTDDDGGAATGTATVTVLSAAQGTLVVQNVIEALLASSALAASDAKTLSESLSSAQASLASGNTQAALGKLGSFDNKVDAMLRSRKISAETAQSLKAASARLQGSIRG